MKWDQFQDTAKRLSQGKTEGDWRSAASRSYYALFHYFREFLLTNGLDVGRGGESHFNLYSGLKNCGYASMDSLADRIDQLRRSRRQADYEMRLPFPQRLAQIATQETDSIIADFQVELRTLSAKQIADGAKAYLRSIGKLGKTP